MIYAGIELGGTKCVAILARGADDVLAREVVPTGSPDETLDRLERILLGWKRSHGFDALGRRIDQASHAYITAVDAHDLDRDDLEHAAAARARSELNRAAEELERVKGDLDRFAQGLGPLLQTAETQLARLAPAVERARQALLAASNALDTARATRAACAASFDATYNVGAHSASAAAHQADIGAPAKSSRALSVPIRVEAPPARSTPATFARATWVMGGASAPGR